MALVYQNLVAWQRADDLFVQVHRLTYQQLPGSERYELGSQLRRAAYSVPANIVEGMTRDHPREAIQFFHIARASLNELAYGLHAAGRLGYLTTEQQRDIERQITMVAGPLHGLIRRYRERGPLVSSRTPMTAPGT